MAKSSSNVDVMLRLRGARKFAKEVDRAGKDLEGMGLKGAGAMAKFANQSKKLEDFGASMTKKVTLPIVGMGAASVMAAGKWESAFAGVRKTVDATETEFAALEKGIREMSMEIPTSANDLAQIAEAAGQLGIETDNILGFTRVIADLGEATNIVGEEGAQQLAKFANIMQMPQKDFDRLGSTIVDLGNNFATTERDILRMGLRLAGAGKQVGMSEANVMAVATAMSSVGIEAEAGGTAMSQVWTDMLSAVLGGGDKLKQFADVAGMSAAQFTKLFKDDSAAATNAFVDGLGRIKGEGGDVTGTLKEMGLGGQRMVRMLLSLSGAGDVFADALGRGDKAWGQNNALTKEAQQRYETFESRLQILRNTLTNLGVTVGNVLLPPLTTLADKLGPMLIDFAEKFGSLSPTMQAVTVAFAGFVAALGPTIWLLGKFAGGIGRVLVLTNTLVGSWRAGRLHTLRLNLALVRLRATMMLQATWAKIVTGAQWLLNAAMTANPIGLLVVGIGALVGAFVLAYHKIGWFRDGVDAVWDAIGAGVSWVLGIVKKHWPKLVMLLGGPIGAAVVLVIKNFDKIKSAATGVKDWVTNAFRNVVGFIRELPGKISRAASGMWDGIKGALRGVLNWIINAWNSTVGKLEFKAPGWVPGIGGKGFSMPTIDPLPEAANGANVTRAGAMLVGEEGPEVLDFPRAARVTPLDAKGGLGAAVSSMLSIELRNVVLLDGKTVSESVAEYVENAAAIA